ncbi:MAG: 50S ribosomal protein L17 [Spirochaetota bacterium]|nr:50S ribosomal protein L17 [Spirochaetota bacterium]
MRHRNNIKQLGKTDSHRKAMFRNMATSLFLNERVVTTKQKGKELKRISEKIITRAKKNIDLTDNEIEKKLHNKRMVMRIIKDRDVVKKLFGDIAFRFVDRNGGYTRLYHLGRRAGDAAEMVLVELVEKKKPKEDTEKTKSVKEKIKKKKNK